MSVIDVARILDPVSDHPPCGIDLEYDAEFLAMVAAATPKPERQMGAEILAAEEPDWRKVRELATQLLDRSKDLRVAVLLCRSLLHTDGMQRFAEGLQLLREMLEKFWAEVFPRLDVEDDNDPTMRVNALAAMVERGGMLRSLRETPLVVARQAGSFSLRDIEVATGRATSSGPAPTKELIRAAFLEASGEQLQQVATAVQVASEQLSAIERFLAEALGPRAPELQPMAGILASQAAELAQQLESRGAPVEGAAPAPGAQPEMSSSSSGGAPTSIQSRSDVVQCLDRICDFYARSEPSSPVPMLLRRARCLVDKSFLEVVRDLVPDGLNQAELFRGPQEES